MARLARLVIPGLPYHVTQRGNRRGTTFFDEDDFRIYRELLANAAQAAGAEVWAYCLMPNHVHLIVVPGDPDGLRATFANAHRRYARLVNARHRWTGHLWEGRFGAVVMDEAHLAHAARYVALNPVRARLCERAEDWPWSSARAHFAGENDELDGGEKAMKFGYCHRNSSSVSLYSLGTVASQLGNGVKFLSGQNPGLTARNLISIPTLRIPGVGQIATNELLSFLGKKAN